MTTFKNLEEILKVWKNLQETFSHIDILKLTRLMKTCKVWCHNHLIMFSGGSGFVSGIEISCGYPITNKKHRSVSKTFYLTKKTYFLCSQKFINVVFVC